VLVGLGKLVQLGLHVELLVIDVELANARLDVGFDIRDAGDRFQIASNRSGTAASRHGRQIEDDQFGPRRRRAFGWLDRFGNGLARASG
jgi:hypothetical protein